MRANSSQLESPMCLTYKAIASIQGSSQEICALKCTSTHENWMEVFTEAKKKKKKESALSCAKCQEEDMVFMLKGNHNLIQKLEVRQHNEVSSDREIYSI